MMTVENAQHQLEALLSKLDVPWKRTERRIKVSTDGPEGPTVTRKKNRETVQEVTYRVKQGHLKGRWSATGTGADRDILDRMTGRLDAEWSTHLNVCRTIAALRTIGR